MKIQNMLQRVSCISFLFKPPWLSGCIYTWLWSKFAENTDLNSKGLKLTEAVAQRRSIKEDVIKNF